MKSESNKSQLGQYCCLLLFLTLSLLAPLSAQENMPTESLRLDSIQFKNLDNDKTYTLLAGKKVKIKMTNGRKLKGQFIRQDGHTIVISQPDVELAVDLALVDQIKIRERGILVGAGVTLITLGGVSIIASGLAAVVAVVVIAFTGDGTEIFAVAAGLLAGGIGAIVLGRSMLNKKINLQDNWRLAMQ